MDHQEELAYLRENLSERVGSSVAALTDDQQRWLLAVPAVQSRLDDLRLQQANTLGLEEMRDWVLSWIRDNPRPDRPDYYLYHQRRANGRLSPTPATTPSPCRRSSRGCR
ncbi:hypothetical protein ABT336_03400 [Micromonospora sp. NPDC000207]|uniref:hypothetical protein n=1 Tax=Micromonospora sp. NPDC000207 TaxID=3154246 RepID=UPI00332D7B79